ncbi:hypothetical protein [Leptospira interrogans]|uniref:hypothetical protein n=1 Tax=Leptospira interrogans TaxID=173 RepID=UPI00029740A2|nr:hypothetical protein LEP1GSC019_3048 [Leptospira interrogans serovar Pyrogenes str. 2006006960]
MFYGDFVSNFFSLDSILFALFDILTLFQGRLIKKLDAIDSPSSPFLFFNLLNQRDLFKTNFHLAMIGKRKLCKFYNKQNNNL